MLLPSQLFPLVQGMKLLEVDHFSACQNNRLSSFQTLRQGWYLAIEGRVAAAIYLTSMNWDNLVIGGDALYYHFLHY